VTATDATFKRLDERPRPTLKSDIAAVRRVVMRLTRNNLLHAGFGSLTDQALVSFSNFVTMVLLARAMGPYDFGVFVVAYTGLVFANSVQSSLITRPHNVFAAPMRESLHDIYTGSAAGMQLLLTSAFASLALVAALISVVAAPNVTLFMLGLAAAVFAWQLQEFVRQVQFTASRVVEVLRLDVISYGGQAVLIALMWYADALTGPLALFVLAGTSLASALYGLRCIELGTLWRAVQPLMRTNWRFGKWLLADNLGQWLSLYIYPVALGALVSFSASAAFRAAQNVVQPMYILIMSFQSLMLPRLSRAYANGGRVAMFKLLAPTTLVVTGLLIGYAALVGVFSRQLLHLVYGPEYEGYASLVWYVGLGYVLFHLAQAASMALMVQGRPRAICLARLIVVPFTLTVGMWITWQYGPYGAALASCVLASGAILALQYAFLIRRDGRGRGTSKSDTSLVL